MAWLASREKERRTWGPSVAGIACGVALILAVVAGPLGPVALFPGLAGLVLGFLGFRRSDRNLGISAMILSALGLAAGLLFPLLTGGPPAGSPGG